MGRDVMHMLQSGAGIFALLALTWLLSENRSAVSWRRVLFGLGVSFVLAVLLLKVPPIQMAFAFIAGGVAAIAAAS
ncbi:MAG: Na+ dependent nucleoside transporter N-terminal domain-containing protein, partial [Sphingomicrobium sp.]